MFATAFLQRRILLQEGPIEDLMLQRIVKGEIGKMQSSLEDQKGVRFQTFTEFLKFELMIIKDSVN
jgi:hypothetical protein